MGRKLGWFAVPREWAKHFRKDGKKIFWGEERAGVRGFISKLKKDGFRE